MNHPENDNLASLPATLNVVSIPHFKFLNGQGANHGKGYTKPTVGVVGLGRALVVWEGTPVGQQQPAATAKYAVL